MPFKDLLMPEEIEYKYYLSKNSEMLFSHVHSKFELYFCAERTKQHSVINGRDYYYDYPCVIISSPYTIHSMSSVDTERYERMVVYFGERTLSQFGDRIADREILGQGQGFLFELDEEQGRQLKDIIYPTMLRAKESSEVEKELTLMLFINRLLGICPKENVRKTGRTDLYIQDVLKYISENFQEDITSDSIAKRFAVSRAKLDRDFKRYTDSTPHAFIEGYRLNYAKWLLLSRDGKLNVSSVASLCGFKVDNYFYSFFKRHMGISPLEYRNNNKKK